jgi:hypothetical protein
MEQDDEQVGQGNLNESTSVFKKGTRFLVLSSLKS